MVSPDAPAATTEDTKPTAEQVRFINLCDQLYFTHGYFPNDQKLALEFGAPVDEVREMLALPVVKEGIAARGIDVQLTPDRTNSHLQHLSSQQILVANAVLNLHDKRSMRQKLDQYGVSTQKFGQWKTNPYFSEYLRSRAELLFEAADSDAKLGLLQLVQSNDLQAIKLYMEIQGIYNPKVTHEVNIPQVITSLVEIVQKHVSRLPNGAQVLHAIAEDVEAADLLGTGRSPAKTRSDRSKPLRPPIAYNESDVVDIELPASTDSPQFM